MWMGEWSDERIQAVMGRDAAGDEWEGWSYIGAAGSLCALWCGDQIVDDRTAGVRCEKSLSELAFSYS